jgi:hypothetical protein
MEKKIKTREKKVVSRETFSVSPFLVSLIFSKARNQETEKPTKQQQQQQQQQSSLQIKNY